MTPPRKPSRANGGDTSNDAAKTPPVAEAFDVWLERGLHDLFDQFADEPIPDSLKAILDADRDAELDKKA